ncbi:MAG: nitronate monooxygenase [Candidatus Eisenbacteria bacterium]|nr:nitronate monooxygenase [Candidatus Eisenbacteria bacterium]
MSDWRLARAVSRRGYLGVVSGTAIDTLLVRRLQDGDPGGQLRRAMAHFPIPDVAGEVLRRFYVEGGIGQSTPYALLPMWRYPLSSFREQVCMLGAFVEVWLAREGHDGPVGMNLLTKIQMPNLATLYGAMLAGVHVVLMGAGIPREIPGVLDALARHQPVEMRLDVENLPSGRMEALRFDPDRTWTPTAPLGRPQFLAIISSNTLALTLARKSSGKVDGFVVEGPTAGGHNAPPRGEMRLNERSEPIYGERDRVDLDKLRELGLPFWLAGGTGSPGGLRRALDAGATGVQVGTLFAFCDESGIEPALKARILTALNRGEVDVITDALASPTDYPFKSLRMTNDPDDVRRAARTRICDLGYLRTAFSREDGSIRFRCAAEPVEQFVTKGGEESQTHQRRCLCNGLLASIGRGQWRKDGGREPPLITSGSDLVDLRAMLAGRASYRADDAIDWIIATPPQPGLPV